MTQTTYNTTSKVEKYFLDNNNELSESYQLYNVPVIIVDNYVELGRLTALRFLEWVALNPGGSVALPTGKTPEFFIKWTQHYLQHWDREMQQGILAKIGLDKKLKPDMKSLHYFQLDEFFPIDPEHERSFIYFVKKFYVNGLGLNPKNVHLIDTYHFKKSHKKLLGNISNVGKVFPDGIIDLSLRIAKPSNERDILKQKAIRCFDEFCNQYEDDIRNAGGIGFFLGGIGPDGHIAFNVRGSSHYSHTRLTNINYETQAALATDLGGIELVRKKAVITMGLQTITYNPDAVVIIIAAGESKARVVADALQHEPMLEYPATCLQKLQHSRFFMTKSSTKFLILSKDNIHKLQNQKQLTVNYADKLLIEGALRKNVSLMELAKSDAHISLDADPAWQIATGLSQTSLEHLAEQCHQHLQESIERGVKLPHNSRILHTAPHHDDIELAYFPLLHHLVRSENIENYFVYCTSGFTAVTDHYLLSCLQDLHAVFQNGISYEPDIFKQLQSMDNLKDDITGYLNAIAQQNPDSQHFYKSTRLARQLLNDRAMSDFDQFNDYVNDLVKMVAAQEPGRKEPDIVKLMKGWLREFEAELAWAHLGINVDHVSHLRLHFYSDDIFPEYPNYELDVRPIEKLLEKIKPTIITLALDPEGSGPDTHYKTLIALAEAIDRYVENHRAMKIRIWGYRNVWSRYDVYDVNTIIPVSLNSLAVLHNLFNNCFLSQKSASFPSHELDGTFSELAQKIWVEQHDMVMKLMGYDFFYNSPNPLLRRAYAAIFLKDMSYPEFSRYIESVRRLLKTKEELEM
ncbi:PIG-L family deacetylase [candidate division KSB1 bacterium]|nr:PIG-L family deacetylase [candidate division KSB1 bacterium]